METEDNLSQFLRSFEDVGAPAGEGAFSLDPHRALELLREQGSVASSAPLFLFKALYNHTKGATLVWEKGVFEYRLCWPERYGRLPQSAHTVLAEGAFAAIGIRLRYDLDRARLSAHDKMAIPFSAHYEKTFLEARTRLTHFPVVGLFEKKAALESWHLFSLAAGTMEFRLGQVHHTRLTWVVDGIDFFEASPLPVDIVITDDQLRCDLSLQQVIESERKERWVADAKAEFHKILEDVFGRVGRIRLDSRDVSPDIELCLPFVPYVVSLSPHHPLRDMVLDSLSFKAAFGQHWSLRRLLDLESTGEKLYVIPSPPVDLRSESMGESPVLIWQGLTRSLGERLFRETQSGAGYLYSLKRGEAVHKVQDHILSVHEWKQGILKLRELGDPAVKCEIELRGRRRASEVIYLDEPAPYGLRVIWESRREVAKWSDDPKFLSEFRVQLVALIDLGLSQLQPGVEWMTDLLLWADAVVSLDDFENLSRHPLFATVDQKWVSYQELKDSEFERGTIPVLEERSASLPEILPYRLVLWDSPLLSRFGFTTEEVSSQIRKAYWGAEGRKKWLARHQPRAAEEWGEVGRLPRLLLDDDHLLFKTEQSREPSRLVIWREERPLGIRLLGPEQFPAGYILLYRDDRFPADPYWSGPDAGAVAELSSWLAATRKHLSHSRF